MKKAIIVIIIAAAAIGACSLGYFKTKSTSSTTNKALSVSANTSATSSKQITNLNNNNNSANSNRNNNSDSNNSSNQQSNTNTTQNVATSSTTANAKATNVSKVSSLDIPSNFTSEQIQTLENMIKADNISPGAGTDSLVVNLDYYSVVNGQKYYAVYGNTIPGTNWFMAGQGPFGNGQGNYSQLQFIAYENQNGKKISQAEFLNGQLSFNPNDTSNLSKQDIYSMVKKIAVMYATYSGFDKTAQEFNASELTNYNKNIMVNTNNTKNINGETYYEVEYESGEPFYISLTGNIYVSQEHYLSKVFSAVPPQSNAQLKQEMKGI